MIIFVTCWIFEPLSIIVFLLVLITHILLENTLYKRNSLYKILFSCHSSLRTFSTNNLASLGSNCVPAHLMISETATS